MADVTYRIIIEGMGGGGGGSGGASGGSAPRSTAVSPKGEDVSPGKALYDSYKAIKNAAPVALALKYVNKAVTTSINLVELRTGRSTYQEQLNWTYSTALKGLGIVGSIAAGFVTGNPLLIIGGLATAADTAIDYGIAQQTLNLERRVENISIGMANIRAGAGGDRNNRATY